MDKNNNPQSKSNQNYNKQEKAPQAKQTKSKKSAPEGKKNTPQAK